MNIQSLQTRVQKESRPIPTISLHTKETRLFEPRYVAEPTANLLSQVVTAAKDAWDELDPEDDPRVRALNFGKPMSAPIAPRDPPAVVPPPLVRRSPPKARVTRRSRSSNSEVLDKAAAFRDGSQTLGSDKWPNSTPSASSMSRGYINSARATLESQAKSPASPTEDNGESPVGRWSQMMAGTSAGSSALYATFPQPSTGLGNLPMASTAPHLLRGWARWHSTLLSSAAKLKRKASHKHKIVFLSSVFEDRPPTLLFQYSAAACGSVQRPMDRAITADMLGADADALPKMYYTHSQEVHPYNSVLNTLRLGGLYQGRNGWMGKYALMWGDQPQPEVLRNFHPYQKTNHFPVSYSTLGRKDHLQQHIGKMKRRWGLAYDIMPQGYLMPEECKAWREAREQHPRAMWIFKPANASCGRGIKVMTNQVHSHTEAELRKRGGVVQRYINDPLTINGYKFDLRLYVVVSSYDPLKIYLNEEGLVRFATEKYSASAKTLGLRNMHLTNYSVNKHFNSYVKNVDGVNRRSLVVSDIASDGAEDQYEDGAEEGESDGEHEDEGGNCDEAGASKWSLRQLKTHFEQEGWDWDGMMERIEDLLIKTLIAAEPNIVTAWHQGMNFQGTGGAEETFEDLGGPSGSGGRWPNQTCFEAYGFDVLIDKSLKPWLLEVNVSPSLSSSSPFDKRVKTQLIADMLTLAGMKAFDYRTVEKEVREERLQRLRGLRPRTSQPRAPLCTRTHDLLSCPNKELLQNFTEHDWQLILDTHDEYMRRGNLRRIFPTEENASVYAEILPAQRYANLVLRRWLECGGPKCFLPGASNPSPPWVPKQIHFEKT